MFDEYPEIMTVPQVGEVLRIGRNSAYMLVNKNLLGNIRIGKTIRVPKICLIEYIKSARYAVTK